MPSRFLCPGPLRPGLAVPLPRETAHHALRVLRLRFGEAVQVFDGEGAEYRGVLVELAGEAGVQLLHCLDNHAEAPLSVTLVQGLAVADKMDWIVQKAVELGVVAVQPVTAERSVLRLTGERAERRVEHWRQVAVAAAEQCGRSRLCTVADIESWTHWLAHPRAGERWVLSTVDGEALSSLPRPGGPVALAIGPEGGWSPGELAAARVAGYRAIRLGPRVLRTETAGLAAVAAMMALWGDF